MHQRSRMTAMCLDAPHRPLVRRELPMPVPADDEVLSEVAACAVCRTDLHIVDGELTASTLPLIPGHGIVGRVLERGRKVEHLLPGTRVGVPWLGATWAGDANDVAPVPLGAVIILAPIGALVPLALRCVRPGGSVVCGGIHMSDIPSFPYASLWGERSIVSVANLTRRDAQEFLALAPTVPVITEIVVMPLADANAALARLRPGEVSGAVVLACR